MLEFLKDNPIKLKIFGAMFVFCYTIILIRIISVPLYKDGKQRDSIHGDAYSDKNAHSTALYYYDFGFGHNAWLPVWNYKGDGDVTHAWVYTHYPAVPDMLAAVYAKILDTKDDRLIRVFPALWSVVFFFLIFKVLNIVLPDKNAAFISAVVLVGSNYFIFWADNLHKHLYEEMLKWLYFFTLFIYYRDERKNKGLILVCAILFITVSNISFEPITYLAVVTVGMSWIYARKIFSWENILLGTAPCIGFGLHFYQNVLYLGSFDAAFKDLTEAATLRTVGNDSVQNEMKRNLGWIDYMDIPFAWLRRIERYFLIAGPSFFFLAYLGLKKIRLSDPKLFQLGIVLILATISWNFAMTQHFLVHSFTTKHLGIFFGFVAGYGILRYVEILKLDWSAGVWYKRAIHIIFIGYTVGMMLGQQFYDYLRYGLLYIVFQK